MMIKPTREELENEIKELENEVKELEREKEHTEKAIHSITLDYIAVEEIGEVLQKILDNTYITLSMAETLSIKRVLKYLEILAKKLYDVY